MDVEKIFTVRARCKFYSKHLYKIFKAVLFEY